MAAELFRFADFELDQHAYRLRRGGRLIHVQPIPYQLLCLLVERQGELVTREEILNRIWGKDVFIDSENGINTAVRKLRWALNDDADAPRFVVTVAGKGYCFIAPISLHPPTPSVDIYHASNKPLPFADKPSIGVLPFTKISSDRDPEDFND